MMKTTSVRRGQKGLHVAGLVAALGVCTVSLTAAAPAQACGGFFCSLNQPVNQQAERIIFVDHPDGTITAMVQVQYVGPSESFSWVVPVPGEPEVGVSSNIVFARLQQATNPFYNLTTEVEGACADGDGAFNRAPPSGVRDDSVGAADPNDPSNGEQVSVVAEGGVGPYVWQLISVVPGAADPAAVAVEWLTENGYDVSGFGEDLMRPYLQNGMNLIGFKLEKNASAGEIRPITMRYAMEDPMVPIKLTAVAAEDNMGVMVFNVSQTQAVPLNYRSLHLNEAAINWFNASANYADVVNLAADEAEGHGFVTEHAGPTEALSDTIWSPVDEQTWFDIQSENWQGRDNELLTRMWAYVGWDGLADAIRSNIPLPEGIEASDVAGCPSCFDELANVTYDTAAFLMAVDVDVIQPVKQTDDLFESLPYLTRLYTTLNAEEMTEDPAFGFNSALPDVDNNHNATRIIECNLTTSLQDAPWRVALPQGTVVRGTGSTWPVETEAVPAAFEIVQHDRTGLGEVIVSNRDMTQQVVDGVGPSMACACAGTNPQRTGFAALALFGLAAVGVRRRKR